MKERLRTLFEDLLPDLDAGRALRNRVRNEGAFLAIDSLQVDLLGADRVLVLAIGKAARPMAGAALEQLGDSPVRGLLVPPAADDEPLPPLQVIPGGHPEPDRGSVYAANAGLELLAGAGADDLVLFLLSGGGSAMFEAPLDAETGLEELRALYRALVHSGAGIVEINTVRKHLSAVKGGRLAAAAAPARQVTLYVSDVPPACPEAVASGPTMPDPTTREECAAILERLGLAGRLPYRVDRLPETPKPGDPAFSRSDYVCLLDNARAVELLRRRVETLGWLCEVDDTTDEQPVEVAAEALLARLLELRRRQPDKTVAVLAGGELSCPVPPGAGTGGRNQQFALCCALRIEGRPIAVLSAGTDGIDGSSKAAGAVANGETVARARAAGLDPQAAYRAFDAYPLFEALGDAIRTGPTGTNVRDVRVLVDSPAEA